MNLKCNISLHTHRFVVSTPNATKRTARPIHPKKIKESKLIFSESGLIRLLLVSAELSPGQKFVPHNSPTSKKSVALVGVAD